MLCSVKPLCTAFNIVRLFVLSASLVSKPFYAMNNSFFFFFFSDDITLCL